MEESGGREWGEGVGKGSGERGREWERDVYGIIMGVSIASFV